MIQHNREIVHLRWDGTELGRFAIPEEVFDIAWLTGNKVAVTPLWADHRVEIWDLTAWQRTQVLARCPPVPKPRIGGAVPRSMLIRFDAARQHMALLDVFTGDVIVLDASGSVTRRATVLPEARAGLVAFLAKKDFDARYHGRRTTTTIAVYPALTIATDGTIWFGEKPESSTTLLAAALSIDGRLVHHRVAFNHCANVRLQAWDRYLISYSDPAITPPGCTAVVTLKEEK